MMCSLPLQGEVRLKDPDVTFLLMVVRPTTQAQGNGLPDVVRYLLCCPVLLEALLQRMCVLLSGTAEPIHCSKQVCMCDAAMMADHECSRASCLQTMRRHVYMHQAHMMQACMASAPHQTLSPSQMNVKDHIHSPRTPAQ